MLGIDLASYARDNNDNEREWVKENARPRMNYCLHDAEPEQPSEMLELLEKHHLVTPYIFRFAQGSTCLEASILSHPDLNFSHLFIDRETNDISAIIDWQGSRVAPLVLQAKIPGVVRHVESLPPGVELATRPSNYNSLDAAAKQAADEVHESALRQKYYESLTAKRNPRFYSSIMHNAERSDLFVEPEMVVCGLWKNREVFKLRCLLNRFAEDWNELGPNLPPCPISFDEEEGKRHDQELENLVLIERVLEVFQEGILPADGRVDPEDFEPLKELNQIWKMKALSLCSDEKEKRLMEKIWPWQDWPERVPQPKHGH